jgi:hypothetical protein
MKNVLSTMIKIREMDVFVEAEEEGVNVVKFDFATDGKYGDDRDHSNDEFKLICLIFGYGFFAYSSHHSCLANYGNCQGVGNSQI